MSVTRGPLPFPKLAIFLLPFEEVTGEHVHHLHAAELLEVFFVDGRRVAVRGRGRITAITDGGGHGTVDLVDHALQEQALGPVAVSRGGGVLAGHGHLNLHPRYKL